MEVEIFNGYKRVVDIIKIIHGDNGGLDGGRPKCGSVWANIVASYNTLNDKGVISHSSL